MINNIRGMLPEDELNYNSLMELLSGAQPGQPQYPMQLAAHDGLSLRTQQGLMQLDRDMAQQQPAQSTQQGAGTSGADSQMTQEWKARNAPAQNRQLEELLFRRKLLEQQLRGRK